MTQLRGGRRPGGILVLTLIGVVSWACPAPAQPTRAREADRPAGSLQWVPADAAFYGACLRAREQVEAVAKSRAWAKVRSLPVVKALWQKVQAELTGEEGKLAPLARFYQDPENKKLVALVGDMLSREVFVYGGKNWPKVVELAQQFNGINLRAQALVLSRLAGLTRVRPEQLQALAVLYILNQNLDRIVVPDLVLGFKLTKAEPARAQLKRLEGLLTALVKQGPPLKGRFQREKLAGGEFLTLRLDGKLVPWEKVPLQALATREGEFDELVKKLKGLKLTLSVGVKGGYLLVAMGETNDHLAKLGKGKLLADRKELKPLAKFAGKRLTSIQYASQSLQASTTWGKQDVESLEGAAKELLPWAPLSQKRRGEIVKDIKDLVKDLKTLVPERGAVLSFAFLTARGCEGYTYDWGQRPELDGSKPLPLLNHVGGNPLLAVVSRTRVSVERYRMLVKWVKVGHCYFEEYAVPLLEEDVREKYQGFAKAARPLFKRLDETTAKMLLPALADGQTGFVLDAKLTSRQWHKMFPETDKALPLPEPALLFGVSDAALLRKAFTEYRAIANGLLAALHDLDPDRVPALKIPPPKTKKVTAGTLYYFNLPEAWGLDPQVIPGGGLSEKVGVLALSLKHSERLLTETPLKVKGGPLGSPKSRLAEAVYLNWEGMVEALAPWAEIGAQRVMDLVLLSGQEEPPKELLESVRKQMRTVFDVLKVVRNYASATYLEDGAWVTHSETVIKDL
jgi:hypothetical protein